ncbi:MAG: anti-sigma factor family protein [Myxococcaceae bacterium]
MNCLELDRFLHPYLDGEFGVDERSEVEKHLSECAECARKVHVEGRFKATVKKAAAEQTVKAPDALRSRILKDLDRESRTPLVPRWAMASAAAVVVVTVSGYYVLTQKRQQQYLDDAALHHSKSLPLEISAVPHDQVEGWFGGKLDHRVPVPKFQHVKLAGARLSNVQNHPAAYISYDTDAPPGQARKRIGLFVFDDAHGDVGAKPLPAVEMASARGYNVATWRDGEIVYELVTDLDENDIRKMVMAGPAEDPSDELPLGEMPKLDVAPASFQH